MLFLQHESSAGKDVSHPFQLVAIDGNQIKSANRDASDPLQIHLRRAPKFSLLASADARRSTTKTGTAALADFDKHQSLLIAQDQIDLTPSTRKILLHQSQSLLLQKSQRSCFGCGAAGRCAGTLGGRRIRHDLSSQATPFCTMSSTYDPGKTTRPCIFSS